MSEELRFGFGKNWQKFIDKHLSEEIVDASVEHMKKFMRRESLKGLTFLDIGCGSGIHSLAALKLGAERVHSFDYDENSVLTSKKVREWAGESDRWTVEQGSVLDEEYMKSLGDFDIVYSWGVLHHTGNMWTAVRNAGIPMNPDGEFYIALYSSDIYVDPSPEEWIAIKKRYNKANQLQKWYMEARQLYTYFVKPVMASGRSPWTAMRDYGKRGMTAYTDAKDWLGGYPMEFAGLVETQAFCKRELGLDLANVLTGEGCTEYLFADLGKNEHWKAIDAGRVREPISKPFMPLDGYAFHVHFDEHKDYADDMTDHMRSSLMVYENDRPLGLAHCLHDHVKNLGKGRFAHWDKWLIFSAGDNTDPNINGKNYTFCRNF